MTYKNGDTVVHWTYGPGKIVGIDNKRLPGQPSSYYVIETGERELWVPVDEIAGSSLHLLTQSSEFNKLTNIFRTPGVHLPDNQYQRHKQLDQRMQRRTLIDTCLILRDLGARSHGRGLSSYDTSILKGAKAFLLNEWVLSLGIPRESAKGQLEWMIKDVPATSPAVDRPKSFGKAT